MKQNLLSTIFGIGVAVLLAMAAAPSALAQAQCTAAVLDGDYALLFQNGEDIDTAGLLQVSFNGAGSIPIGNGWVAQNAAEAVPTALSGAYSVNVLTGVGLCEGSATLVLDNPLLSSPVNIRFTLNNNKNILQGTVTSPTNLTQINVLGRKIGDCPPAFTGRYVTSLNGELQGGSIPAVNAVGDLKFDSGGPAGREWIIVDGVPSFRTYNIRIINPLSPDCTAILENEYLFDAAFGGITHRERFFVVLTDSGTKLFAVQLTENTGNDPATVTVEATR